MQPMNLLQMFFEGFARGESICLLSTLLWLAVCREQRKTQKQAEANIYEPKGAHRG